MISNLGPTTTATDVLDGVDLADRRFVVTGASSGLGEESTRALTSSGASVTMLARDESKLAEAVGRVRAAVPDAMISTGIVDLASFDSIRAFADAYLAAHGPIDVLMNNAGVMACPKRETVDGFEMQFGTNHLGHFLLTALLFPAVMAGDARRVVNLTSAGHTTSDVDLDDINFERTPYDPWVAYGRSKTANALFSRGLAQRYGDVRLLSFAVHPGGIVTDLGRHLTEELMAQMMERSAARAAESGGEGLQFKTVEAGAATQVWAAVAPDLGEHNGAYLADCQLGLEGGNPNSTGFSSHILDDTNTERLWTISEDLVGEAFPPP